MWPAIVPGIVQDSFEEHEVEYFSYVVHINLKLNIIEHFWDEVERLIGHLDPISHYYKMLVIKLKSQILQTLNQNLVEFMPRKINPVSKANGDPTKY